MDSSQQPTYIAKVASALGTAKAHNVPVLQNAASDIVQIKSRQALAPLLEIVLARATYDCFPFSPRYSR